MRVVYFPEELNAAAPNTIGCLCEEPSGAWVTMRDIVAAIRRREPVAIRPASDSEMKRAESCVVLAQIGDLIGEKIGVLLDQDPPEVADKKSAALRNALVTTGSRIHIELLDRS